MVCFTTKTIPCIVVLHSLLCATASAIGIYGGDEAEPRRYPYAVSFQAAGASYCGGSLIAPDVVLSAAHCDRGGKNWMGRKTWKDKIIVGRQVLDKNDEGGEYEVRKQVRHPEYSKEGDEGVIQVTPTLSSLRVDNDFMLVFLKESVAEENAQIIDINPSGSVPADEARLTVMGWGDTDRGSEFVPSNELLVAEGVVISNEDCLSRRGETITYEGAVTNNELCMGEDNSDESPGHHRQGMCRGDSGGPLIVRGDGPGSDVLVGVVSWGPCGSNKELPGVYARVSAQYDWIVREVCEGSDDPPSFFGCPPKKSNVGIIVGCSVGAAVIVAAAVGLFICRRRRKKSQAKDQAIIFDAAPPETDYLLM